MKWILSICLLLWALPTELPAGITKGKTHDSTWNEFNKIAIEKTDEIRNLMFGPIVRIIGVLGVCYAVGMLFMGKYQPMILWGSIGILLNIIPIFIDGVLGAKLPGY